MNPLQIFHILLRSADEQKMESKQLEHLGTFPRQLPYRKKQHFLANGFFLKSFCKLDIPTIGKGWSKVDICGHGREESKHAIFVQRPLWMIPP
jgi:hypothetical protein